MSSLYFRATQFVISIALFGVIVGCDKASDEVAPSKPLPVVQNTQKGDSFTLVDETGATIRINEMAYSSIDALPESYVSATVDYVPLNQTQYIYTEDSGSIERWNSLPAPVLNIYLATQLDPFSGAYGATYEFRVPGITTGTYYADNTFHFEIEELANWRSTGGVPYLDKVVLSEVGEVGGLVKGSYYYWVCSTRCEYRHGDFSATREADIELRSQGSKTTPIVLNNATPYMRATNLVAKANEASYYAAKVTPGGSYSLRADSYYGIVAVTAYSDSDYTSKLCVGFAQCSDFPVTGDKIYIKAEIVVDIDLVQRFQIKDVAGALFSIYLGRTDFTTTPDTAINLGDAPLLRKIGYASANHVSYYKANIEPKKYYLVATYSPLYNYANYTSFLSTSTQFNDINSCSSLSQDASCTFLAGDEQTDLVFRVLASSNTPILFTVREIAFKSEGTPSAPVVIDEFDYSSPGHWGIGVYESEVDSTASYYKVAVVPNQKYRAELFDVMDTLGLTVYAKSDFTGPLCEVEVNKNTETPCEFSSSNNQVYVYVKVDGSSADQFQGSHYYLAINGVYPAQGSIQDPLVVNPPLGSSFIASSGLDTPSYYKITLPANTPINISLQQLTQEDPLYARAYYNSDFLSEPACNIVTSNSDGCVLVTGPTGATLYLYLSDGSFNKYGSAVKITLKRHEFKSQGFVGTPALVGTVSDTSFQGENGMDASYLKMRAGSNQQYIALLDPVYDDLNLHVYSDSTFSQKICSAEAKNLNVDICKFKSGTDGFVYFKITGENAVQFQGSEYSLGLSRNFENRGTEASPVVLGSAPVSSVAGTTASSGYSTYTATVEKGKQYFVKIAQISHSIKASVYNVDTLNSGSGVAVCSFEAQGPVGAGLCQTPTTTSNKLWVRVNNGTSIGGSRYTISIVEAGGNEGTALSPVYLDGVVLPLSRSSSVAASGASYYTLAVTTGQYYQIALSGNEGSIVTLYSDSQFSTQRPCSYPTSSQTATHYCQLKTGTTENRLYLKVSGPSTIDAEFTLNIYDTLPKSVGNGAFPIMLPTVPFKGQRLQVAPDHVQSYYAIPVKGATEYSIQINDFNQYLYLGLATRTYYLSENQSCSKRGTSIQCTFVTDEQDSILYLSVGTGSTIGSYLMLDVVEN